MLRKMMVALFVSASAAMLAPDTASARFGVVVAAAVSAAVAVFPVAVSAAAGWEWVARASAVAELE